ncbi:hypothetical protein CCR87_03240, partial [Rhodobaculum claviforme]|nr:hypothetical protein [Rhodobaculum claviforme]
MRGLVEASAFGGLALVLHVALWAGLPGGAAPGAGQGGGDAVTVQGAAPAMAALVAQWDRPPQVMEPAAPVGAAPVAQVPPPPA